MATLGDTLGLGNIGGMFGTIMDVSFTLVIALLVITILGGGAYWYYYNKKKWFLHVEVKIPRTDGKMVTAEWAKGTYDAKKGVVFIKRHKKKPVALKPFDIKKYLQGDSILTVVQVGIEDYRPVLNESYILMADDQTGEEAAFMNIKIDTSESRAWKNSFERDSKNTYSIMSILHQNAPLIAIGIVIFLWGIQFLILYNRISN